MLVLNLNVTGVTELHVNGAVLNHIKSVNTNVTIVIINHQKINWKTTTETLKDKSTFVFTCQSHIALLIPKVDSSSGDVPRPRMILSYCQSLCINVHMHHPLTPEPIEAERWQWGTARLLHMCNCTRSPSMIILNPRSPDSYLINVHRPSSTPA